MKKIIRLTESDLTKIVKQVISEQLWGKIAKFAKNFIGRSEDDLIRAFRTTESAVAKEIDDIVLSAIKSKSIAAIDDLEAKLIHFYNPSGKVEGVALAKEETKKFLNSFAKTKGKPGWGQIRNETIQGGSQSSANASRSSSTGSASARATQTVRSGTRVSNSFFKESDIDWSKITNAKNLQDYNKLIATAIKTGDYKYISSGGFEKYGIDRFRDWLRTSMDLGELMRADPKTGTWFFTVK